MSCMAGTIVDSYITFVKQVRNDEIIGDLLCTLKDTCLYGPTFGGISCTCTDTINCVTSHLSHKKSL